ncbi:hypothetical protein INS49_006621 [Diaporthe citri]|uniref:uncharacterized protein n=1 Tax=Diaporthe citri TaxID=83186 RepID=UPI001C7FC85E|nr:uncharacterized protein INS49_006621 [Diaporthe citri]KAG6365015.1 hypothetical protein INS49_006621 [Diaporthe citri]
MDGAQDKDTGSLLDDDDGEFIDHDEAHGVFRSPRPSVTLQELQERESRKHSGGGDSKKASASPFAMRGGIFGGNPLNDLWKAQEMDVGGDPCLLAGSAVLDAEAHRAWDEAAREKHNEINWRDEGVFSDSETEDLVFVDSDMEDAEEASSDDGRNLEA